MAATNMTAQSRNITGIQPGGDGNVRPHDMDGLLGSVSGKVFVGDLNYLGAFRVPDSESGGTGEGYSFSYNEHPILALNGSNMLVSGRVIGGDENSHTAAEISIPPLVAGTDLSSFIIATYQQSFTRVVDAPVDDGVWYLGKRIAGMLVHNGKLIVGVYGAFAQDDVTQTHTVIQDVNAMSATGQTGFFKMAGRARSAGWMSPIPVEHQAALGGTHTCGWSSGNTRNINNRHSIGPSCYIYDFGELTDGSPPANGATLAATPLMNFPLGETGLTDTSTTTDTLSAPGQIWTNISEASYGFIIPGTKTYACFGFSGGHATGCGYGTNPTTGAWGYYHIGTTDVSNYYWFFDVDDLIKVKNGSMAPNDMRPYAHGAMNVDGITPNVYDEATVRGGVYDPDSGVLYLSIQRADGSRYPAKSASYLPLIVAYSITVT